MKSKNPQLEADIGRFAELIAKTHLPASLRQFSDELDWAPSYTKKVYTSYKKRVWNAVDVARDKYNGASPEEGFNKATKEALDNGLIPTLSQYVRGLGWCITGPTTVNELDHFLKIGGGSLRFAKTLAINRIRKIQLYKLGLPFNAQQAIENDENQRKALE